MLLDPPFAGLAQLQPRAVDQEMDRPAGGWVGSGLVLARRPMVEGSGTSRSSPSRRTDGGDEPCRRARRKTARSVSAVVIARAKESGCPPGAVRHAAIASFREPDGQAASLAQPRIVLGPVRHPPLRARDGVPPLALYAMEERSRNVRNLCPREPSHPCNTLAGAGSQGPLHKYGEAGPRGPQAGARVLRAPVLAVPGVLALKLVIKRLVNARSCVAAWTTAPGGLQSRRGTKSKARAAKDRRSRSARRGRCRSGRAGSRAASSAGSFGSCPPPCGAASASDCR